MKKILGISLALTVAIVALVVIGECTKNPVNLKPPAATTLVYPTLGATNVSTTPTFVWDSVSGARTYCLQIATDSAFTALVENDSALTKDTLTISSGLIPNTIYFWRVKAKNASGVSAWSLIWSFKTRSAMPLTNLTVTAPTYSYYDNYGWTSFDTSTGKGTLTVTFSASDSNGSSDTITYTLLTGKSTTSLTTVYTGKNKTFNLTNVDSSSTIYWKLIAKDLYGYSTDTTGSFVSPQPIPPPSVPILSSPLNNSTSLSQNQNFSWDKNIYNAVSYHLQISKDFTFASLIIDTTILSVFMPNSITISLTSSAKYYWRVNASNLSGTSSWSSVWSFTTEPCSALGTGTNGTVLAIVADASGNIYAGGSFDTAGGINAKNIAKWNGSSWSALGTGMDSSVAALAVDGTGNLFAGGSFITANGATVNHIAKWNGSSWSALGIGMNDTNGYCFVSALAVDGSNNLYAGGAFTTADGVTTNNVAKWNGSSWSNLGSGVSSSVSALAIDKSSNLFAATSQTITEWNGSSWSYLVHEYEYGYYYYFSNIAFDKSNNLDVGFNQSECSISRPPCNFYSSIYQWNGSNMSSIVDGYGTAPYESSSGWYSAYNSSYIYALATDASGYLYVGGTFSGMGGVTANNIAMWK